MGLSNQKHTDNQAVSMKMFAYPFANKAHFKKATYTGVPNSVLEKLAQTRIGGAARSCLDVIMRKTYGWHKSEDRIALTTFAELTGLRKEHVTRALKRLTARRIIIAKKGHGRINIYGINENLKSWMDSPSRKGPAHTVTAKDGIAKMPKEATAIANTGSKKVPEEAPSKEVKESNKRNLKEKERVAHKEIPEEKTRIATSPKKDDTVAYSADFEQANPHPGDVDYFQKHLARYSIESDKMGG